MSETLKYLLVTKIVFTSVIAIHFLKNLLTKQSLNRLQLPVLQTKTSVQTVIAMEVKAHMDPCFALISG
jgi:hypothetical protein